MVFDDGHMVRAEPEAVDLIELEFSQSQRSQEERSVCLLLSHHDLTQPNDIYSALLLPLFVQIQLGTDSPILNQCLLNGV